MYQEKNVSITTGSNIKDLDGEVSNGDLRFDIKSLEYDLQN